MARGGKKNGPGQRRGRGAAAGGRAGAGEGMGPRKPPHNIMKEKGKNPLPAALAADTEYWLRAFGGADETEKPTASKGTVDKPAAPEAGEEDLWAQVARGVKPLWVEERKQQKLPPVTKKPAARKKRAAVAEESAPAPDISFLEKLLRQGGGFVRDPVVMAQHAGLGLDRRSDLKLKRGRMEIEARIDLHGMNRTKAYDALRSFIITAQGRGQRCVLVITGKGRGGAEGILKREVPDWLSQAPLQNLVLRFYRAQPQDGGSGALYVLLRRDR